MTQKTPFWLICILSSLILVSCTKNNDVAPVNSNYSTKLLKACEIDTTKQAPNDTLSKRFFTYDYANRLIIDSFISTEINAYTLVKSNEFNVNDTFAFRSIKKSLLPLSLFLKTQPIIHF